MPIKTVRCSTAQSMLALKQDLDTLFSSMSYGTATEAGFVFDVETLQVKVPTQVPVDIIKTMLIKHEGEALLSFDQMYRNDRIHKAIEKDDCNTICNRVLYATI